MEIIVLLRLLITLATFTVPILIIGVVIYVIKLMKQRNEYLKEIRDELRNNLIKRNDQFTPLVGAIT